MPFEYKHIRRVEFPDTDMTGIMHFSRFFVFMESAEHAFFRSLGFSIVTNIEREKYGWPRLHVECDYKKPLYFEDEVEIHLYICEIREKTIRYEFIFRRLNRPEEIVAKGIVVAICTKKKKNGFHSTRIPEPILQQLEITPV